MFSFVFCKYFFVCSNSHFSYSNKLFLKLAFLDYERVIHLLTITGSIIDIYSKSLTLTSSLINGDISDPILAHTDADPKAIFRTTVGNTSLENM